MKFENQKSYERKQDGIANRFNADHPERVMVRYWKGAKQGEPTGSGMTRTQAQIVGGTAVVWIEGCSGCVALSHVEVE